MNNLSYNRKKLELIALCKSFLHQEYTISLKKEKTSVKPIQVAQKPTISKKEILPEAIQPKEVLPPPKKIELVKAEPVKKEVSKKEEPVKNEEKKKEPLYYDFPFLKLLPRKDVKNSKTYDLSQIEEFLVKSAPNVKICKEPLSDELAQSKESEWKKNSPKILFISFLPKESEEDTFVLSVVNATKKHLGSAALVINPKIDIIGELIIAASEEALKNVIIVYKKEKPEDFFELISSYISVSSEQNYKPLSLKGSFVKTSFFEYKLEENLYKSPDEKADLWKTLRSLFSP